MGVWVAIALSVVSARATKGLARAILFYVADLMSTNLPGHELIVVVTLAYFRLLFSLSFSRFFLLLRWHTFRNIHL